MPTTVANATFAEIAQMLREHESFALFSHVRPDGDAIGSQLALGLSLRQMGKEVTIIQEEGLPDNLNFLPGGELIELPPSKPLQVDVAIALDTANYQRIGEHVVASLGGAPIAINIDHHITNPGYGQLNYIDCQSPATGQILYELIREQDLPLTYAVADNLYTAISTDTGSFQYPNTTARTFEIGAELVKAGVDVGKLSALIYERYPLRRLQLFRELLNNLKITAGGKVASWHLTQALVDDLELKPDDSEGLIDHIRAIDGVIVAVFFEELPGGKVRLSMRSKSDDVDVCKICSFFGGGGHRLAAGARVQGDIEAVEKIVLQKIYENFPAEH